MTNLLKTAYSKAETLFANTVPSSQRYCFSSSHGCEICTIKKAEWQRTDAFELWCQRRLFESLGLQGDPTNPS